jgi:hypothetical protein
MFSELRSRCAQTRVYVFMLECPLLLSDLNKNWNVTTNLVKLPSIGAMKLCSAVLELIPEYGRTDGQTDVSHRARPGCTHGQYSRHDVDSSDLSETLFRMGAGSPSAVQLVKEFSALLSQCRLFPV